MKQIYGWDKQENKQHQTDLNNKLNRPIRKELQK